jgi:hypothetical protein
MSASETAQFPSSGSSNLDEDKLHYRRDRTMRKFFAAAGSLLALTGLAGVANASATIDLIWAATGTNQIGGITSPVSVSSTITLQVILTAGSAGSAGAGVSVDYSGAMSALSVIGYASLAGGSILPNHLRFATDTGSQIENINRVCCGYYGGIGLVAGASAHLGTVTFHRNSSPAGTFEIGSDANGPTDGVLNLIGGDITSTTTFNSAFIVPEPNALTALGSGIAMLALLYRRRA